MTLAPQSTTVERPLRPLEDPSGRRLRWMRWVGRAIALVFLLWFVALALGALGVAPNGGWLPGRALGPQSEAQPLVQAPAPPRPASPDFASVLPEARTSGHSVSAPRQETATTTASVVTTPVATTHGRSATAPGRTKTTTHGRSSSAPGHTKTHSHTRTTASPGNGHAYGHNSAKTH